MNAASDYSYSGAEVLHHVRVASPRGRGKTANFSQAQVDALAEVLRGLLTPNEMTQAKMAKMLHTSQQTVSRVSKGERVSGLQYQLATDIVNYAGLGTLDDFFRARGIHKYQLEIRDRRGALLRVIGLDEIDPQSELGRAITYVKSHSTISDALIASAVKVHGGPDQAFKYLTWVRHFLNAQAVQDEHERAREAPVPSSRSLPSEEPAAQSKPAKRRAKRA